MIIIILKILKKFFEYNSENNILTNLKIFLTNTFNNLDNLTKKIMKAGFIFCFILVLISIFILITYNLIVTSPFLFSFGLSIFKLSTIFAIEFIICGLAITKIKNELI